MLGVLGLGVPTAFFAALDRGSLADLVATSGVAVASGEEHGSGEGVGGIRIIPLLGDERRGDFLKMSRAMAILLLLW
jgi:Ca2+:H+ antiporter